MMTDTTYRYSCAGVESDLCRKCECNAVPADDPSALLIQPEYTQDKGCENYREKHQEIINRIMKRPHINEHGQFQSDKYPTTPPDLVPLKVTDPMAQDLLIEYARRRRQIDKQFSDDLIYRLKQVMQQEQNN